MTDTPPATSTWSHELVGDHSTARAMRIVNHADMLLALHETAMCREGIADLDHVRVLARWLIAAADVVQERLCGSTNRSSWSHRTCLDGVLAALHAHPVPWDADGRTRQRWFDDLTDRAAVLIDIAAELEDAHRAHLRREGIRR